MGRTRLVLVFALALEDVEEVGGGGVDLDEVLVGLGHGVWDVGDSELRGVLIKCSVSTPYIGIQSLLIEYGEVPP